MVYSWITSKVITQISRLESSLLRVPTCPRGIPQNSGRICVGVAVLIRKPASFLEMKRDRTEVTRKLHTHFRLVPKSITLDDLERPLRTLF